MDSKAHAVQTITALAPHSLHRSSAGWFAKMTVVVPLRLFRLTTCQEVA